MSSENKPTAAVPELSYRQQYKKSFKRILRWIWGIFILGFVSVFSLFAYLSTQLPSFDQLENPQLRLASEVYSSDGELLGKYYIENRTLVTYDSIAPAVVNALVSTEDARFYSHSGIDPEALARVLVKTIVFQQRNAGGGSTISQQLSKLLVGRPDTRGMGTVERLWTILQVKLKEWLTAVKLERSYTKKEIITNYLNEFDFLYNAHGIRSAAETYFRKKPSELSIPEAAMLVRMLKNPALFNYRRDMKKALKGREVVLKNMQMAGHITEADYHKYRKEKINKGSFQVLNHNEGQATYFREYLREYVKEVLSRPENLKPNGEAYDVYRDGLKIYTTIDSRAQRNAEQAVWDHLSEHQEKLFKHWKDWNMIDPPIGYSKYNPWTYKTHKNTEGEIQLRLRALDRLIWNSERYQAVREDYLKTAAKYELRDIDISRLQILERANKKRSKKEQAEAVLAGWEKDGYATKKQIVLYRDLLKSGKWETIKGEYQQLLKYMQTPVDMRIFAYQKNGEHWGPGTKDTLMSPLDSIRYHRMFLQTGSVSIEPQTGHVKAWVGGIDHHYFKLDHVSMGGLYVHPNKQRPGQSYTKAGRQVGSSMKPFLYALNIDLRGYSPCYEVEDVKITIEKGYGDFGLIKNWTPKNANGQYSGQRLTLTQALRQSLNSVSAQLMKDLGSTERFRSFLHEAGIDTAKVPASPTICLGTPDLTPLEMAAAYCIFANKGIYNEPVFVERIEDRHGNLIYNSADQITQQVLSESSAYVMSQMLKSVQAGAPGFQGIKSTYGGKTGTTNFQADGWFMGVTPNLVVGTWVGCDDRFIRFRSLRYGQGGSMARPIFQNVLRYLEADEAFELDTKAKFPKPERIDREMNCLKYAQFGRGDTFGEEGEDMTNQDEIYNQDYDDLEAAPAPKKQPKKKPQQPPTNEEGSR